MKFGYEIGEVCRRNNCAGVIEEIDPDEGCCSCHIHPPCSYCTTPKEGCPECGWKSKDDTVINDYRVNISKETGVYKCFELRKLDSTKIDYYVKSHTNSSQICEGVFPDGTSKEDVLKMVKGTFGGRFEHFGEGKFKYIAYTD